MKSKLEIDKFGNKRWKNEKGEYHNEDGPAVIYANGTKVWYINGKEYSFNQWLDYLLKHNLKTKDEILVMKLLGEVNYDE